MKGSIMSKRSERELPTWYMIVIGILLIGMLIYEGTL